MLPFTDIDVGKRVFGDGLYLFVRYIWAVNVEVLFYACVFAVIVTKSTRDITRWLLPAVVAILGVVVSRNYYIYAPFFMLGALLWYSERSRHWTVIAAVTLCFVAIAVSPAVGNLRSMLLIAIWTGAMMALSRLRLTSRWRRLDKRLGDLSYPLYLNHYAVLVAFSAYAEARSFYLWLFAIFASLMLAGLVHHLVERPLFSVRAAIRLSSSTRATRIGSTEVTA